VSSVIQPCVHLCTVRGNQIKPDPLGSKNNKRRDFCANHDGYGDFCDGRHSTTLRFIISDVKIQCTAWHPLTLRYNVQPDTPWYGDTMYSLTPLSRAVQKSRWHILKSQGTLFINRQIHGEFTSAIHGHNCAHKTSHWNRFSLHKLWLFQSFTERMKLSVFVVNEHRSWITS